MALIVTTSTERLDIMHYGGIYIGSAVAICWFVIKMSDRLRRRRGWK